MEDVYSFKPETPIFVGRNEPIQLILDWINNKEQFPLLFLCGSAGVGKSTLLYHVASMLNNRGKNNNVFSFDLPEYSYQSEFTAENLFRNISQTPKGSLILLDNYVNQFPLQNLISLLTDKRGIIASRDDTFFSHYEKSNTIWLNNLNMSESAAIIKNQLYEWNYNNQKSEALLHNILHTTNGNPTLIKAMLRLIKDYDFSNISELQNLLESYRDGQHKQTNLYVPPAIIIPTMDVNVALMQHLAKHPNDMLELHSRQYEEVVAELYASMGFEVTLTPRQKDGGLDICAVSRSDIGTQLFIIECKKYSSTHKVGVELVRNLYGVLGMDKHGPSAGIIATTSYFTKDAKDLVKDTRFEHRIKLQDYDYISALLKKYYSR